MHVICVTHIHHLNHFQEGHKTPQQSSQNDRSVYNPTSRRCSFVDSKGCSSLLYKSNDQTDRFLFCVAQLSTALDEKPVNSLIQKVILEEKSGQDSYRYDDYKVNGNVVAQCGRLICSLRFVTEQLKWNFENELDLVFVAVHIAHILA